MQAYMGHVTDTFGLRDDIIFNTRVTSAEWDNLKSRWVIFVKDKVFATAKYFALCSGYAGKKYVPNLPGLSTFEHAYHSSHWPEDLDYKGKRVGVIGTGSSGIQAVETIGPHVEHLVVFQRTPNLCNPRRQESLTPEQNAEERKFYPERYKQMHSSSTGLEVQSIKRNTFDDDDQTRWATYSHLWAKGAQNFWFGNYEDLLIDPEANREAYCFWRSKVGPRINDPLKRALLCPIDPPHPFGTKRPSLEETYFEVFNQTNVDLVDLKTDEIAEATPRGIRMVSGAFHELDMICLATGYDFGIGSQLAFPIKGVNGEILKDKWIGPNGSSTTTFLGLMTHGFPNLIFPAGPQAPTAFGITPRLAEVQGNWIADMLECIRDNGLNVIEPTLKAEKKWKELCIEAVEKTLIAKTDGWYMGNNVPGRKKHPLFWFGGLQEYMNLCQECADKGYAGFEVW